MNVLSSCGVKPEPDIGNAPPSLVYRFLVPAVLIALLLSGCATLDDTDQPWSSRESWEGAPTLPGMPGSGGY